MNDTPSFGHLQRWIADTYGRLDILINNAGFGADWTYSAADVPITLPRETFEINYFALVALTQQLLPLLRRSLAGRIVNQSSVLASLTLHSTPGSSVEDFKPLAYRLRNAFTVHLAHALSDTPIKVNAAHPGNIATDMNPTGLLTPADGARTAVRLATLPADGPTGGFFHLDHTLPW